MARPALDTDELADLVLDRLADGESLRKVCDADDTPSRYTARRWLRDDAACREGYARACHDRADSMNEELLEIADDTSRDWQDLRLRIQMRQWMRAKVAPRKYGDKVAIGGDADAPPVRVALSDSELARKLVVVMTKGLQETEHGS